jgi:hypothetical protein
MHQKIQSMKKLTLLLSVILLIQTGCDFGDINSDPTRVSEASLTEMLPVALTQSARNIASIGGRVAGTAAQHWTGISAQPEGYTNYLIDENTLTSFWETGLYAGAMKDCALIMEQAAEAGQPYYEGIARVLMAFNLGIATSFWGDVPYSEALQGSESLKAAYDSQELVYESIQTLLDEAIVLFESNAVVGGPSVDDLIFNGDAALWRKTAYALKARYTMHLVRRYPNAAEEALVFIDSAFTSSDEQPAFLFGLTNNESNPIALYGKERPNQMDVGHFLVDTMVSSNDPRRYKYWVENNGQFMYYEYNNTNLVWAQQNSPLSLITYTEVMFLKAEAYLRADMVNQASQTYSLALIHNMLELGISSDLYNPYLAANAGFGRFTEFEDRLERIILQKHIALYGQNPIEAWVDYRRTGYPELEVPATANSSLNPSLVIPRRFLYPISERTTNLESYNAAIESQGGHLMDVDMWAFKPVGQ